MKIHRGFLIGLVFGAIGTFSVSAMAHHSMSEFAPRGEMVELEGVISKLSWRNPHIMFELTTKNANGVEEVWVFEAGAVSGQRRKGLTGDEVSVGDQVRMAGFPSHRRDNFLKGMHLLLLED